ncbi:MAG TPA: DUF3488 and transglutaminase-like domain-containing protein, partial [Holophagaceae bacterium]|nr:DUF3488 and transglutaminase-like domain-containing protein [Holophagaceae bacterium]
MRYARWLDHLPVWLAYGAVATTGIYEPWEIIIMALPVVLAALVELLRMDLGRWRRSLEILALVLVALDFLVHRGFFGTVVHTLFLLCGLRLALPREAAQRRQLLLMGFLLFLTTAISTADLAFLAWALLWLGGAATVLLQLSWEHSASLRRGPTLRPPYGRVPLWSMSALCIAAGFFLILPRLTLGWRPLPSLGAAMSGLQAGLSDRVDLSEAGRIQANGEVVMRVIPPAGLDATRLQQLPQQLAYFRGLALERVNGMVWGPAEGTPTMALDDTGGGAAHGPDAITLELYMAPSLQRLLALPYGTTAISMPYLSRPRRGQGGTLLLPFTAAQGAPVKVLWRPSLSQRIWEAPPLERRKAFLTQLGPEHAAALRAGRGWVSAGATTRQAVAQLVARLQGFSYTLDNPSGTAANPLEDFLERTKAGHCEFFASSLALMLRARGIPSRVVSGYRLGPWVPEGGYFLVTQNEAHAWVEYWDDADRRWHMADASPVGGPTIAEGFSATMDRWADVLRFRWNRYVVRFSDEDQQSGLGKMKDLATGWRWQWRRPSALAGWALALAALAWGVFRLRRWRASGPAALRTPQGVRELKPLLARTRAEAPPFEGETLRAWLLRLATLRPERAGPLAHLADAAERFAYGAGDPAALRALAR